MCGIYGSEGFGLELRHSLAALDTLAHRGPDGSDHHVDARRDVFLGHRRLAIVDLSAAGAQPMPNEDGRLWLVLNGEIYNHEELQRELEAKGHRFRGRCDAEVVLHLYEEHGADALGRLHGMFAFALYDERDGSFFLARDRIGIKPLYYYDDGRRFAFASEPAALRATPGLDLERDPSAWYDFLTYQLVPAPKTAWRRVRKLPAGHLLVRKAGRTEVRRWWDLEFEPDSRLDEDRALEALDLVLTDAVRAHQMSDVPLGLFLSGGVDSSLVAAYAARAAGEPLEAFSVRFRDGQDDEAALAEAAAKRFGMAWTAVDFEESDLLETIPRLPEVFGEPFADQAALPMLGLSRLAASRVKVVLSGDGGDETHLGYGRYFKERERRGSYALADALGGSWLARSPLGRLPALRNAAEGTLGRLCHFYGGIPRHTKRALFDVLAPELEDYDDYWLYREHDRPELEPLARLAYLDFQSALPDGILAKVDRTTMRSGLEARPPLLDHHLVELAARIPSEVKAPRGERKHLLKRLLERHLPAATVRRRKRGFSIPIRRFVEERGLLRLERDLEIPGAFRISREKAERLLSPARDSHAWWLLHTLARFSATSES
jgi:asparagine synthase (glutamine-hydrolysing)